MRTAKLLILFFVVTVVIVGCKPKMITVSSGEKVVCSECSKVIRSDVKTRQVPEDEVSNFVVREVKEICPVCQAKIEARRKAEEEKQRKAELERKRAERIKQKSQFVGTWRVQLPFGNEGIVILNSDNTGTETITGGDRFNLKWHSNGRKITVRDQSEANMSGSMSEDGKSFTVSGYSEWEGRNVSATYLRY